MRKSRHDDKEWEEKWRARMQGQRLDESHNGLPVPKPVFPDPRHQQIRGMLPESMHSLFDEYIESLIRPEKSRE